MKSTKEFIIKLFEERRTKAQQNIINIVAFIVTLMCHRKMGSLFDRIISEENLYTSACMVKQKGCMGKGVDGIHSKDAINYFQNNKEKLSGQLQQNKYHPLPIKRIAIEKPSGGIRLIGIPSISDKIIQKAMVSVLYPLIDSEFSDFSYGFREGKSLVLAIEQAKKFINDGYEDIIQIDIHKFFDTLNHDRLMSELYKITKDKQILSVIRKYLNSDVVYKGKILQCPKGKGIVQGGNLSPLLANVYLNALDKELSRRGIRFVRYVDDITIFCNSPKSAEAIMKAMIDFIEKKLLLRVNQTKSCITKPLECNLLGFTFYKEQGQYISCIPEKSIIRMQNKLCRGIKEANSYEEAIKSIHDEITGWTSHYHHADRFISGRRMSRIDRLTLETLYKKFSGGCNIKDFKAKVEQEKLNLSLQKLNHKLSDNK